MADSMFFTLLFIHIVITILTFIAFIKHEQRNSGNHKVSAVVMVYFIAASFWFLVLPSIFLQFILKKFVELITSFD